MANKRPRSTHKKTTNTKKGAGSKPTTAGNSSIDTGAITVRMYRVGFGDCFLVSLPAAGGGRTHILIDCGVHSQGDIGTLPQVVADIAAVTDRTLAVVIATHAHQDHLAGFARFGDEFAKFKIGEVWLPWTWDPGNPLATKLQRKHLALSTALDAHFSAQASDRSREPDFAAAAAAVANLSGNARAIALLKAGFAVGAVVRFLKAGDALTDPAGVAGLKVTVLGPPQSEAFLGQMDPPASEHYLRLLNQVDGDASGVQPFDRRWRLEPHDHLALGLPRADEEKLGQATSTRAEDLAFALDKARNNESVVTLLGYRGQTLLFAGDAQYGNWRWWLENEHPEQLLPPVSFFKVAHHGSVNATPKAALEAMTEGGFAAMVSTQSKPWPSIPRVPLMQRLSDRTTQRTVRSDWLTVPGGPRPAAGTAPKQPSRLPSGFTEGPFWFDYVLRP
jgi:beta-lactamase superfamily II metal-dependent hydrolase